MWMPEAGVHRVRIHEVLDQAAQRGVEHEVVALAPVVPVVQGIDVQARSFGDAIGEQARGS
jgi:hypothetical protein